jgi:chromosome partitioning protein
VLAHAHGEEHRVTRVIAIANQKGGVGKTTTALNLGSALAERGRAVLLVDLDQQGSLTISAGLDPEGLSETVYTVLSSYADPKVKQPTPLATVITPVEALRVDLAPANIELAALDLELTRAYSREHILRRALEPTRGAYDYVLLDCPPSLGLVVINALTAADEIIVPLQTDYLATKGVKLLMDTVEAVQAQLNPSLHIGGILLTQADQRTSHARQIIELTRSTFDGEVPVFKTLIKLSVRLKEAPITGQSILAYDPTGEAATAYRRLAQEVDDAA